MKVTTQRTSKPIKSCRVIGALAMIASPFTGMEWGFALFLLGALIFCLAGVARWWSNE